MADSVGVRQGEDWKRRQIVRMGLVSAALFIAGCQVVPKAPPKPVEAPPEEGPTSGLPTDATRHRIALLAADLVLAGWFWLRRHPELPLVATLVLVVLRPRRVWRWGGRLWWVWRRWRRVQRWLDTGR